MAEEKSPQEQVKEAVWKYTGWGVIILSCIGAGYYLGYLNWGDAPSLRKKVDQFEKQVLDLRNEREALNTQIAMTTRDRDECRKSSAAAAAPPPAEAAPQ